MGIVAAIVIIIIILGGAAYFVTRGTTSTSTSSSSSVSTSSTPGSSTISSISSSASLGSSSISSSSGASSSSSTPSASTSSASSSTGTSSGGQEFIVDEPGSPDSVDVGVAISGEGEEICSNTYLPLLFFNQTGGYSVFVPVLAKSWTESANGTSYIFNLRSDVHYSNGDPFNAYVAWYNIYRNLYLNQAIDSPLYLVFKTTGVSIGDVNSLNNPQNSPGSNTTLLNIMQNSSNAVTVLNSTAVEFHLTNPFVSFLQVMPAGNPWNFADPYVIQQHGGVVANTPNSWMSVNGSNIGDGPYVVQTYIPNQYTLLVANPNYWAQNITDGNFMTHVARYSKVLINYKTDELTRELDVESNKAQASVIALSSITNVLKTGTNLYVPNFGTGGTMEWLQLDTEKAPLNNSLVRQAIVAAVNLTEIRQTVFQGYNTPVVGPNLNGFFGYNNSITPPPYNLTLAKALLVKAGYPNGQGLPPISFAYPTGTAYIAEMAQILVSNLAQIGITIQPQSMSVASFISATLSCCGNSTSFPDIAADSWSYWPDFSGYEFLVDQQLGAFFYLNNQTIHNLIIKSNSELNSTLRAQELSQITIDVQQNAATIWLGQDNDLPTTGNGVGPTVFNKCITGDPNMWQNPSYWVFVGLDFNQMYSTC